MKRLKKGDEVIITSGKNKGKIGIILSFVSYNNRVLIEGINLIKKHIKPNQNKNIEGGIVTQEGSIHISNVALYNSSIKKADKIGYKYMNNKKFRYFKSNGQLLD